MYKEKWKFGKIVFFWVTTFPTAWYLVYLEGAWFQFFCSISNPSKMLKKSGLLGIFILSSYLITTIPASAQLLKAPVAEDVTSLERKPNDESSAAANSLRQRLLESKQQQSQQSKKPRTVHRMETRWRKFKQELDVLFGLDYSK
jgi:hypothetical protein